MAHAGLRVRNVGERHHERADGRDDIERHIPHTGRRRMRVDDDVGHGVMVRQAAGLRGDGGAVRSENFAIFSFLIFRPDLVGAALPIWYAPAYLAWAFP